MSDSDSKPKLSVVIPTLGRPILIKTLDSLGRSQGFEILEIIVAGMIPEGPVLEQLQAIIANQPQVRHLPVVFPVGDSSEKKNAGYRAARADIVAFLDDDVVVAPDWRLRMLETFNDPKVGLVSGPSLVPDDISALAHLAGVALASKAAGYVSGRYLQGHPEPRKITWSRIIGCNMAYRRPVLEEIGMFDPAYWPGEEMIASFRALQKGYVLMFNPQAYVYHYPRESLGRFWKQIHGYGATRIRLLRGGVDFEPTTIVPGVWVLSLLVLGIGALFSKLFLWLLLLDLSLYFLADVWITLSKFNETRRPIDLLLLFIVPVLHLSYGIAEWVELLRPDKDLSEPTHGAAGSQG